MTTAIELKDLRGVYRLDPAQTRIAIDMPVTIGDARRGSFEYMSGTLRVVETRPWGAHFVGLIEPGEFRDDPKGRPDQRFSTTQCIAVASPIQLVLRLSATASGDIAVQGHISSSGLSQPVHLLARLLMARELPETLSNRPSLNLKGRLLWPCPGDGQLEGTLGRDVIEINIDAAFTASTSLRDDEEQRIDEALDESFPASDPPAYSGSGWKRRAQDEE